MKSDPHGADRWELGSISRRLPRASSKAGDLPAVLDNLTENCSRSCILHASTAVDGFLLTAAVFMHELGITQQIVEISCAHVADQKISKIIVEIGKLSAVLPDAVQFCFDLCAKGTAAEGATLEIIETPGLARCCQCGAEFELDRPYGVCRCGSSELELLAGDELRIRELEITSCVAPVDARTTHNQP